MTTVLDGDFAIRCGQAAEAELHAYWLANLHFNGVVPDTFPFVSESARLTKRTLAKQQRIGRTAREVNTDIIPLTRTPHAISDMADIIGLDLVLGNADRHSDNWLISDDGHLWAIDHELYGNDITLREALKPAYLSDMIDDGAYTLLLIAEIKKRLIRISEYDLAPPYNWIRWRDDLLEWLREFKAMQPQVVQSLYASPNSI